MRRDVSPATSLRTGSNGLRYRFFASLRTTVYWRSLRQWEMMRLPEGLFARANYQIYADAEPKAKLNGIRRLRRRS